MSLELLAEQPGTNTRTESDGIDESAIDNIWVFQFDGTAANGNDPALIKKVYKTDLQNNKNIRLIKTDATKQLVVVLANSFDPTLGEKFTVGGNTPSKYSDFKALLNTTDATAMSAHKRLPMSAAIDMEIPNTTHEEVQTFEVKLKRNVAKVTLKVKLASSGLPTTNWSVQACDATQSYWLPNETTTDNIFPPKAEDFANKDLPAEISQILPAGGNTYDTYTWYIPVNRRGIVESSTSSVARRTKASAHATYIKVSHRLVSSSTITTNNYYIHLGANFTTDYNVCGNTTYTYQVTLYPRDDDSDSRAEKVETSIGTDIEYVGKFAGELKEHKGVWQFTKELWMDKTETTVTTVWHKNGITDPFDGKANTLALWKKNATTICQSKNAGLTVNNNTTVDDPNYQWYIPAQSQVMAFWIANNSYVPKINTNDERHCWSSTNSRPTAGYCWFMSSMNGYISYSTTKTTNVVRCVKDF